MEALSNNLHLAQPFAAKSHEDGSADQANSPQSIPKWSANWYAGQTLQQWVRAAIMRSLIQM